MCAFADKKNVGNRNNKQFSWEWLKIDHCYYTHSTAALIMAAFTMEDYHQLFIWMIPIIYIYANYWSFVQWANYCKLVSWIWLALVFIYPWITHPKAFGIWF
jgi:hypothetical protein